VLWAWSAGRDVMQTSSPLVELTCTTTYVPAGIVLPVVIIHGMNGTSGQWHRCSCLAWIVETPVGKSGTESSICGQIAIEYQIFLREFLLQHVNFHKNSLEIVPPIPKQACVDHHDEGNHQPSQWLQGHCRMQSECDNNKKDTLLLRASPRRKVNAATLNKKDSTLLAARWIHGRWTDRSGLRKTTDYCWSLPQLNNTTNFCNTCTINKATLCNNQSRKTKKWSLLHPTESLASNQARLSFDLGDADQSRKKYKQSVVEDSMVGCKK